MDEHLLLKWGTLKGWKVESEASVAALKRYFNSDVSMSAMKQAICDLIDAIDGPIQSDWDGAMMTKEEAKKYVLEYPASAKVFG